MNLLIEGYAELNKKQELQEWLRTRELMWLLYAPNVDSKKAHAKNKFELMPLEGDKIHQPKPIKINKKMLANIEKTKEMLDARR